MFIFHLNVFSCRKWHFRLLRIQKKFRFEIIDKSKMQHFNTSYDLGRNLVYLYFRAKFYV